MIFKNKPKLLRIALDKNEVKKREQIAKTFSVLIDFGTEIKILDIKHESAKDFAELQELGLEKLNFTEEKSWTPKSKKDKIIESITNK